MQNTDRLYEICENKITTNENNKQREIKKRENEIKNNKNQDKE